MTSADPAAAPTGWSRTRWTLVVLLLAAVQGAAVLGLTRWPGLPPPDPGRTGAVRLESADAEAIWLGDPRQFTGRDPAGFSGAAARGFPPPDYALPEWTGRARWLGADPDSARLGTPPGPSRPPAAVPLRPPPARVSGEGGAPRLLPSTTVVSPRGALANRPLHPSAAPSPPPGAEVLGATVVDVGLHPDGTVIVARVTESSGNPEADLRALSWTRAARFAATGLPSGNSAATPVPELTWGQLAFLWRVEPAAH